MARGGGSRGGGGGGGGRGFGGGGGRGFGGRAGGGGGNRGGFGGGGNRGGGGGFGGFGGGFGGPPRHHPHRPPRMNPFFGWGRGPGWGGGPGMRGGGGCCGCLTLPVVIILLIAIIAIGVSLYSPQSLSLSSGDITKSTVKREPLPRGSVTETGYYTDELGWISNQTELTTGMKNFYQKTGVQPYLYITDTVNNTHTPTENDAEIFAQAKYDELFSDEAHVLIIFFEYIESQYHTWYITGNQAKTVLDTEAMDILLDYIDNYYYGDLSDEAFFSKAFNDAGDRIMEVTQSPWINVLVIIGVLVIIIILYIWWSNMKKQKNAEAEHLERVLKTPLETFGEKELDDLTKKYDDPK